MVKDSEKLNKALVPCIFPIEHIWEGIYPNFKQCPLVGEGFSSGRWIENSTKRIKMALSDLKKGRSIPEITKYSESLLPIVVAMIESNKPHDKIRILDFGGGIGITYLQVISGFTDPKKIDYFIFENENVCRRGEKIFKNAPGIHFISLLPKPCEKMDIVHLGSSIQYIDQWEKLMEQLSLYNPDYILFTDLYAGDIPSYVTVQNYYDSKIPHHFINIDSFLTFMGTIDYWQIFKSTFVGTFFGNQMEIPQQNFPEEYRLNRSCSLLFIRGAKKNE